MDSMTKKDEQIDQLQKKLEDAENSIKIFMEEKRQEKIESIKSFAGDKFNDSELEKMDLKSLELVEKTVSKFAPSAKPAEVLPITGKDSDEKDKRTEYKRVDPSKVFAEVNKKFEMSGF